MEAEEAEENQKMYGLMRAKETKEVEKDLVSRGTPAWPVFIVSLARKIICQLFFYDPAIVYTVHCIQCISNIRFSGNI